MGVHAPLLPVRLIYATILVPLVEEDSRYTHRLRDLLHDSHHNSLLLEQGKAPLANYLPNNLLFYS